MSTDVLMPQMGESVAEGTLVRWIKKVGDTVDKDEPLFEISTDKVDTEVPSPGEGVVSQILVGEGQTVDVGTVLATIAPAGSTPAEPASESPPEAETPPDLKPGKYADITVLSKDILKVPEDEIPAAKVAYTIVGGKVLYKGK